MPPKRYSPIWSNSHILVFMLSWYLNWSRIDILLLIHQCTYQFVFAIISSDLPLFESSVGIYLSKMLLFMPMAGLLLSFVLIGLIHRLRDVWWRWWWIVFVVWLTDERRLVLFPAGTIVIVGTIFTIANLRHAVSRVWTCTEPEFRLSWMELSSSDNHYTTAPRMYHVSSINHSVVEGDTSIILGCVLLFFGKWLTFLSVLLRWL